MLPLLTKRIQPKNSHPLDKVCGVLFLRGRTVNHAMDGEFSFPEETLLTRSFRAVQFYQNFSQEHSFMLHQTRCEERFCRAQNKKRRQAANLHSQQLVEFSYIGSPSRNMLGTATKPNHSEDVNQNGAKFRTGWLNFIGR